MNPIAALIADHVVRWRVAGSPPIIGICGTQASGKSTACAQVADCLAGQGLKIGVLSLDDLYLGRTARAMPASTLHPLFATRGPPGTHDTGLGVAVLDAVRRGEPVLLPRFDKRADEPLPREAWPLLRQCDVLLFEGWCVGARAQDDAALIQPVNALERDEDPEGIWRRAVNAHLAGATGALFARIDRLIYLRPPGFDIVHRWRCEQERDYIARDGPGGAAAAMTDAQVARFIAHYERLTCHIMDEMPSRADLVIQLDTARGVAGLAVKAPLSGSPPD